METSLLEAMLSARSNNFFSRLGFNQSEENGREL